MEEIQFLTYFWNSKKVPRPQIVYAGAAPGVHIPFLAAMFPELTFHLYDPSPFKIQQTERIFLYNQLFLDADAQKWAGRDDVYFISDIRSDPSSIPKNDVGRRETLIVTDMRRQEKWVETIRPIKASLKFRLRYTASESFGGEEYRPARYFEYLDGLVYIQPWARRVSSETRLIVSSPEDKTVPLAKKVWDIAKYESQMFFFNVRVRPTNFINPFVGGAGTPITTGELPGEEPGLVNDYDSTLEAIILRDYLVRTTGVKTTADVVSEVSSAITVYLNPGGGDPKNFVTLARLRRNPHLIEEKMATRRG
jgi:hypothetical protein